jgi:hypothetical protein
MASLLFPFRFDMKEAYRSSQELLVGASARGRDIVFMRTDWL